MGSLSRIAHVLCTGGAIFYASDRLWRDLVRFPNSLLQEGNLTLVQRRDCKTSNQVLLSFSFLFVQIFPRCYYTPILDGLVYVCTFRNPHGPPSSAVLLLLGIIFLVLKRKKTRRREAAQSSEVSDDNDYYGYG